MTGCHVMAKPASSRCNLDCRYCFYLEKPSQPVMDMQTLETFIRQHIAAQPGERVEFAWQGGEPTLCGLDFFRRVVALQQRYADGKQVHNALQTNGVLLTDAWCRFLYENRWLVGVSLDGPEDMHDVYRVSRSGRPTHHKVIKAIEKLRAHRVDFNLMVVVNTLNVRQPVALYRYLRALGTPFLQFIPLVERDAQGELTVESVTADAWGAFLTAVFDCWFREDIGRIYIQQFDSTLGVWCGSPSQMCIFSETCGHAFALESNGDLYQCDHYVYPDYLLGNLHQTPLCQLNDSPAAQAFGRNKKETLSTDCRACPVLHLCHGDCPKHRDLQGKSVLCRGYYAFFNHTAPLMATMRDLIRQHRSPVELMKRLQ